MGLETTFYPFRAVIARQPNPACAWAARCGSTKVNGPIYETGSTWWAKAGHGLVHTDLTLEDQFTGLLFGEDGAFWNDPLISVSPECHQQSPC